MASLTEKKALLISKKLFKDAFYLREGNEEKASELVQQTWEKALCYKQLGPDKLNYCYMAKMMERLCYNTARKKKNDKEVFKAAISNDYKDEDKQDHELQKFVDEKAIALMEFLNKEQEGWIYLELVKKRCTLKRLSQIFGIKYEALKQRKKRVDIKIKRKFGDNWKRPTEKRGGKSN